MSALSAENKDCGGGDEPIFILGILPRCGTNYLSDLLCVHPDCAPPAPIWEDFLICHSDLLDDYVDTVADRWSPRWSVDEATRRDLAAKIGGGLLSFLSERTGGKRLVAKTPRVDNLDRFFRYMPNAKLLILVRDGRSVLESGIKSFGWNRDAATHWLAEAARAILELQAAASGATWGDRVHLVRYESLWTSTNETVGEILRFLDLDASRYDFGGADSLPIRGSSATVDSDAARVHWKPVEKPKDFDPLSRFRHWGRAQHERYDWVAGKYMEQFGYEPVRFTSARRAWTGWNLLLDIRWLIVRTFGRRYLRWRGRRRKMLKARMCKRD
jgi:protein-tyrosine sulfotransferase